MSLISSLQTSFISLRQTESQIETVSSNVTNADKAGYTRKTYESTYVTNGSGTVPNGGTIVTDSYDTYLYATMLDDLSDANYYETHASYLTNYADRLGQTDGDSTLSSSLNDLSAAFESLSQTPEDTALKSSVVQTAQIVAYEISALSDTVQDLRTQADNEIATTIDSINQALQTINDLNETISKTSALGQSTADLEDERRVALEALSGHLNIDYFTDSTNQVQVYTDGTPLLTSHVYELEFTSSNQINSALTYPSDLSGITVNGTDITNKITGGTVGALLELRDSTLTAEQEKLDELANTLIDATNTLLNQGASTTPRTSITGDVSGLTAADAFVATGNVYIATMDNDAIVTNTATLDLSTVTTLGDLVTEINTSMGGSVTASIDTDGQLNIVSTTTGEGIVFHQMDSELNGGDDSFSSYFGLNNLFTGDSASNIKVADYLQDSSAYLATSAASNTAIIGETAVYIGDSSLSQELSNIFSASLSFDTAGDFAAHTNSIDQYAIKVMSSIATSASNSTDKAEAAVALYTQTSESLINLSGVNVDEELTRLIELEAQYEAAATMLSVVQDMFEQLIVAVR